MPSLIVHHVLKATSHLSPEPVLHTDGDSKLLMMSLIAPLYENSGKSRKKLIFVLQ